MFLSFASSHDRELIDFDKALLALSWHTHETSFKTERDVKNFSSSEKKRKEKSVAQVFSAFIVRMFVAPMRTFIKIPSVAEWTRKYKMQAILIQLTIVVNLE